MFPVLALAKIMPNPNKNTCLRKDLISVLWEGILIVAFSD